MDELSMSFDWDCRAYSLESFVDDPRNILPCVVQTAEGFCPELEEYTLENGQILILHQIRQEQFAVVTHPNGAELCIPRKCPVKVELVPLDRLNEEYSTVEELFMAQPDYFRVLDDIPSLDIKSGSVMKICSRQNGVYHLECEAVDQTALCQEIVELPLTQQGRFQPLHDAREYLLEEVLVLFPPPSKIGIRFINSSSTGSLSFTPDTQLPWGSGLRVQGTFHDDTIIATAVGDEGKEVLLIPKTLDVSVVPALDSHAKCEKLSAMGRTSAFDCLVEQAMKFNSLREYHGSCRLRRFNIEDLTTQPWNEPCDILPNLHEPPAAQTTIRTKGEQGAKKNSVDPAPTNGQTKQTWPRTPFCPAVQTITPLTTSVSLQRQARLNEKRQGRVGLESLFKECDDDCTSIFSNVLNAIPSLSCRQEDPKEPAKARSKVRSKSETQNELPVSRSFSESDLDKNMSSEEDDSKYDEVLSDGPNPVPPLPRRQKRKERSLRRQAYSRRLAKLEDQVDYTNETRSTLALPLGLKSLSESDLYRQIAQGEGNDDHHKTLSDDVNPIPLPPRRQNHIGKPISNPIPLPPRLHKQSHKPISNPIPFPPRLHKQSHKPISNPIPLPPRLHKQSHKPISNPIPLPPRLHKQSDEVVSNPIPLPPRGQRPSVGTSVEMEKTARESPKAEIQSDSNLQSKSLTSPLGPESLFRYGLSRSMSSDKDEDGYTKISDNSLIRGISLDEEDGYSTVSRHSMSTATSLEDDDGYSRISENSLARSLSSDEEEDGYSTVSPYANESQYTEIEDELEKTRLENEIPETEQWSCGAGGPKVVRRRPASYWYAYQHVWLRQLYSLEHCSTSYVNRPLLRPRRRQHSDSTTDEMKKKSMKPRESNHREEEASSPQSNNTFLRKKSRSEGDVFRNSFSTTEVGNLDDEDYIEILADADPDGIYLEPVDSLPGAAELQLDSRDTDHKRVTIGVEGQESHERRISRNSSQEEDLEEYIQMSSLLHDGFVESILSPMSDGVSTHADDQEEDTEEFKSCRPVHIDDQNHDGPKLLDKPTFVVKNIEECAPSNSAEASGVPPVPPRKPSKELSRTSDGESELVKRSVSGIIPLDRKLSEDQKDLYENTDYPVATEISKERTNCAEDGENEDCDDSSYEEYDLNSTAERNVDIDDPSLKKGLGLRRMTEKKQKDGGKTTRENENDEKARRLQESWAERFPMPSACRSSCCQLKVEVGSGEKNISPTPNVNPQDCSPKSQKKNIQETITKNQQLESGKKKSSKPIPQMVPEHDLGFHKRDCEREFENLDDIQRFFDAKNKKTLINVNFEAELSRVISIRAQHASRAQQNLAISTFGPESSSPSLSTEEQSEKHTNVDEPKRKKAPVRIPKRKGKSPT